MYAKYHIIHGGGKFGIQAVKKMKNKTPLIIIDSDPNAEISKQYPLVQLSDLRTFFFSDKNKSKSALPKIFFLEGDIALLNTILSISLPEYIIPVAPIHVMKELFIHQIHAKFPDISIQSLTVENLTKVPDTMFTFPTETSLYVSYAKWEEKCPDNCPAPLGYCPIHKREKPSPIFTVIQENLKQENHLGFISEQLLPGLGGINISKAIPSITMYHEKIQQLQKNTSFDLVLSTACRCHGVIDKIKIINHANKKKNQF